MPLTSAPLASAVDPGRVDHEHHIDGAELAHGRQRLTGDEGSARVSDDGVRQRVFEVELKFLFDRSRHRKRCDEFMKALGLLPGGVRTARCRSECHRRGAPFEVGKRHPLAPVESSGHGVQDPDRRRGRHPQGRTGGPGRLENTHELAVAGAQDGSSPPTPQIGADVEVDLDPVRFRLGDGAEEVVFVLWNSRGNPENHHTLPDFRARSRGQRPRALRRDVEYEENQVVQDTPALDIEGQARRREDVGRSRQHLTHSTGQELERRSAAEQVERKRVSRRDRDRSVARGFEEECGATEMIFGPQLEARASDRGVLRGGREHGHEEGAQRKDQVKYDGGRSRVPADGARGDRHRKTIAAGPRVSRRPPARCVSRPKLISHRGRLSSRALERRRAAGTERRQRRLKAPHTPVRCGSPELRRGLRGCHRVRSLGRAAAPATRTHRAQQAPRSHVGFDPRSSFRSTPPSHRDWPVGFSPPCSIAHPSASPTGRIWPASRAQRGAGLPLNRSATANSSWSIWKRRGCRRSARGFSRSAQCVCGAGAASSASKRWWIPGSRSPPRSPPSPGSTARWWEGAPRLPQALSSLRAFAGLGPIPLVAHNAAFDSGFLRRAYRDESIPDWAGPVFCTRKLARRLLPHLDRYHLDALCAHFGLQNRARHRALGDAAVTAEAWIGLVELARQQWRTRTLGDLLEFQATTPARLRKRAAGTAKRARSRRRG